MHDELYIEYLQKELLGTISAKEKSLLDAWKGDRIENQELANSLHTAWQISESYGSNMDIDKDADYELLQKKIRSNTSKNKTIIFRPWFVAAATILALIAAVFLLRPEQNKTFLAEHDGHKVILPDGTKIEMSKGSKLEYKDDFTQNRTIKFEGSALLEVSRDEQNPFVVISPHLETKVLGTIFFVHDHKEDPKASIQLLEGSVEVKSIEISNTIKIAPNQSVVLGNSRLKKVSALHVTENAWYYGSLNFVDSPLGQLTTQLEKRYSATINISEDIAQCSFSGNLNGMSLKAMINAIAVTYGANVEHPKPNVYNILKGSCN